MKRVVAFILVTVVVILVALGVTYHEMLWEAIKSFPKDWLLWYLIGTLVTVLVFRFIPKSPILRKKKHE